jgi:hypothetical protein
VNFLRTLVFKEFNNGQQSLQDHVVQLATDQDISLRKQSLDERFSGAASDFIRELLIGHLNNFSQRQEMAYLGAFEQVYLQDSTKFKLPHASKEGFPGYHQAGASIQVVLDIKQRNFTHVSLHPQTHNDVKESGSIDWLLPGALLIRDLGYFSIEGFRKIQQRGCFFLSRLQPKSALFTCYEGKFSRFDIRGLYRHMKKYQLPYIEKQLYLGHEHKFPVRVCFFPVPQEVRTQRIKRKKRHDKNRGWATSKSTQIGLGSMHT